MQNSASPVLQNERSDILDVLRGFALIGVGLGFGGYIGPALFIPIGLLVYAIQVLYSNLWFKYFIYGPFEWVWRMLTYGKILKMVKTKN